MSSLTVHGTRGPFNDDAYLHVSRCFCRHPSIRAVLFKSLHARLKGLFHGYRQTDGGVWFMNRRLITPAPWTGSPSAVKHKDVRELPSLRSAMYYGSSSLPRMAQASLSTAKRSHLLPAPRDVLRQLIAPAHPCAPRCTYVPVSKKRRLVEAPSRLPGGKS